MKNMQNGKKASALTEKAFKRKTRPSTKGADDANLKKKIANYNEEGKLSKNGMFGCLAEMAPIHAIDAISSWVFIIAFGIFNCIYWGNIAT